MSAAAGEVCKIYEYRGLTCYNRYRVSEINYCRTATTSFPSRMRCCLTGKWSWWEKWTQPRWLRREVPGKDKKERGDFWEELWRNDAGYMAGMITDTYYYLWLTQYLDERDIYDKDNSMPDGHFWLETLLLEAGVVKPVKAENGKNPKRGPEKPLVFAYHQPYA